ncbi:hypothetical protein B1R94_28340 [Mycolicibacterium litorale]|nr:hypothetical protein B1R94_28340 [Mycolicibacterium litorale]
MSPQQRRHARWLLVAITAVSVSACGSSHSSSAPQATATGSATSAPAPATKGGKDHVAGLITSVSANSFVVNQKNGAATVGFSTTTKISQTTPAALTDVTPGSCVSVRPERGSSPGANGAVTAAAVQISSAKNGACFANVREFTGAAGVLRGTVNSVDATTLVVAPAGGATPATAALTTTTSYARHAPTDAQAIAQGECVTARGTTDGNGTLQADTIALRPAVNGKCQGANR